jgi:hypothetical protein
MRLLLYSQIALAVLAALAILSSEWLGRPRLMYSGAICLGGLAALAGIDTILTRHVRFFETRVGSTTYRGLAAQLWGITFIVMGGAIAAFGVSGFTSLAERSLAEALLEQPGIPLIGLAAILLGAGGATLLGPAHSSASRWDLLLSLPNRLAGLIGVVLGVGVMALGVVAILDPGQLEEVLMNVIATVFRILG